MSRPEHRISDEMASEVLAEAARLNMEAQKGYSPKELEQAGLEAQISPETIGQAIRIVEERWQAKRENQQRSREQAKQKIKKITSIGFFLGIPIVLAASLLIFPNEIDKITKLPDLQNRIQELENEKQQIQVKLENANEQLKLKNEEVDRSQKNDDKFIKEIGELQQKIEKLNHRNADLESNIMFRDSFAKAVVGKTADQVIQTVGTPDRTSDFGSYSHWYYDNKTKDRITGKLDASVSLFFVDGIVDEVNSY